MMHGIDKEPVSTEMFLDMAAKLGVKVRWIEATDDYGGFLSWSEGKRPTVYVCGTDPRGSKNEDAAAGFSLAHEIGHYFVAPYLEFIDMSSPEDLDEEEKELLGYSELEADQFAVAALVPARYLRQIFRKAVIDALFGDNSATDLVVIRKDVFEYCKEQNLAILTGNGLSANAERNLKIRALRFIHSVVEQMIVTYAGYPDDIESLDPDLRQRFFDSVENDPNLSPEDREYLLKLVKSQYSNLKLGEKILLLDCHGDGYDSMSHDDKLALLEHVKAKYRSLSHDERDALNHRVKDEYSSMSDDDKLALLERIGNSIRDYDEKI